jgi:hypothetical protein
MLCPAQPISQGSFNDRDDKGDLYAGAIVTTLPRMPARSHATHRSRGMLQMPAHRSETRNDPMSPIELLSMKPKPTASPLGTFAACARQMLDAATPEQVRCAMEPKLLAQLPALRALGV